MGDEINRDLFLDPSLVEDEEDSGSPLLDQAIHNVEEQTIDNLEQQPGHKPLGRKVDGIIFGEGSDKK
jgi:hypothetical protein